MDEICPGQRIPSLESSEGEETSSPARLLDRASLSKGVGKMAAEADGRGACHRRDKASTGTMDCGSRSRESRLART